MTGAGRAEGESAPALSVLFRTPRRATRAASRARPRAFLWAYRFSSFGRRRALDSGAVKPTLLRAIQAHDLVKHTGTIEAAIAKFRRRAAVALGKLRARFLYREQFTRLPGAFLVGAAVYLRRPQLALPAPGCVRRVQGQESIVCAGGIGPSGATRSDALRRAQSDTPESRWGGWLPLPASKRQCGGCQANHERWEPSAMQITTVGLDLAKSVFQVHAIDRTGEVVVRRALRRAQVLPFFEKLEPCLVGIEACGTSHHWARELARLGTTGFG
jgi:hypothetical protein